MRQLRLSERGRDRYGGTVKVKAAPVAIKTEREALEAFDRVMQYADATFKAYSAAQGCTPGTQSFYRHIERSDNYDDAFEAWSDVLRGYLAAKAGVPDQEAA